MDLPSSFNMTRSQLVRPAQMQTAELLLDDVWTDSSIKALSDSSD